jgi:predicted dehydrogenase
MTPAGLPVKKQIGVVVECGAIAREHLAVLQEFGNVDIAAVCDISAVRAEATAERFGIRRWYTDHKKVLSDFRPDLVHITTPPAFHADIAKDCLTGGVNVLCEKPITINYSDFLMLKQLAIQNNLTLMENQQFRCHSSIRRIRDLIASGKLGDLLEVQICISQNITEDGSPYADLNAPHYGLTLPGGVIGDFIPHIAYLTYMFTGSSLEVRTVWEKRLQNSPLPAHEFRGLIRGERASAYVSFNGAAEVDGFWVRVVGSRMRVEANLFEPPRFSVRRRRRGERALMTMIDGVAESRDLMLGSVVGFIRKLAGTSSYDGLAEMLNSIYRALHAHEPQPIPLDEIDEVARLVERLSRPEFML